MKQIEWHEVHPGDFLCNSDMSVKLKVSGAEFAVACFDLPFSLRPESWQLLGFSLYRETDMAALEHEFVEAWIARNLKVGTAATISFENACKALIRARKESK